MDFIKPGIVDWKRVKTVDKMSKMAAKRLQEVLGNCNYAVELGRKLNFSLVGIAGLIKCILPTLHCIFATIIFAWSVLQVPTSWRVTRR